jgi:hypothetical protein
MIRSGLGILQNKKGRDLVKNVEKVICAGGK